MTDASPGPAGGRPGTPGVHDRVVDLEQQAEQPGADVLSIADELTAVSGQTSAVDYAAAIGPQQAAVDLLRSFTPTPGDAIPTGLRAGAEYLGLAAVRRRAEGGRPDHGRRRNRGLQHGR